MVNGMTCAVNGADVCSRLFPDMLWVDFIDPGYTLCMTLRANILKYAEQHGHQPEAIFLKNHGLFVAADTPQGVREIYSRIMDTMSGEYEKANITTGLDLEKAAPDEEVAKTADIIRQLLGPEDAAHVCNSPSFEIPLGPLTPDHIVYSKAYPFVGELTVAGIEAFKTKNGYSPRVMKCDTGIFAVGSDSRSASLALELAEDGAVILKYTNAFGGVDYMTKEAADFIDNWEVEAYRRTLVR